MSEATRRKKKKSASSHIPSDAEVIEIDDSDSGEEQVKRPTKRPIPSDVVVFDVDEDETYDAATPSEMKKKTKKKKTLKKKKASSSSAPICDVCNDASSKDLPHIESDASAIWGRVLKIGPSKPFIQDTSPLSEFLSICNLGAIKPEKEYLLPQARDLCNKFKKRCPRKEGCEKYDGKCVSSVRVRRFTEADSTLGSKVQGKLTVDGLEPFSFVLLASHTLVKFLLNPKTKRLYVLFQIGEIIRDFNAVYYTPYKHKEKKKFDVDEMVRRVVNLIHDDPSVQVVLCGHSMGGALALHCAEQLERYHPEEFGRNCLVIASGVATALSAPHALTAHGNVSVYYTGAIVEGRLYVDPFFCLHFPGMHHFEHISILVMREDGNVEMRQFDPQLAAYNCGVCFCETPQELKHIHELYSYRLFFQALSIGVGGGRKTRRKRLL